MPNYGFICEKCKHKFDAILSMEDREKPLKKPCPECKEKAIVRDYNDYTQVIGSDATLTPDKATGGKWSALMGKMKKGISKRHHEKLDRATARSGKYWSG